MTHLKPVTLRLPRLAVAERLAARDVGAIAVGRMPTAAWTALDGAILDRFAPISRDHHWPWWAVSPLMRTEAGKRYLASLNT